MINLSNIENAQLTTEPWEHKIVDNFYDEDVFFKFFEVSKKLEKYAIEGEVIKIYPYKLKDYEIQEEFYELMILSANHLLKNLKSILNNFSTYKKSHLGYFCLPHFSLTGGNFRFPIHTDSFYRALTAIVYISDGPHRGTLLYKSDKDKAPFSEIYWRGNRAFLMCPESNKPTWHTWENFNSDFRISMNFSCHRIEHLYDILDKNDDEGEMKYWFIEEMNKDNLVINNI